MAITSAIYVMLSSVPMFVCAFWTLVFGLHYPHLNRSKKILCVFMLIATSLYFGHFVIFNHLNDFVPLTDTLYSLATLSVYPLFFLYIRSLTGNIRWRNTWILLPGLLIAGVIGICYVLLPASLLNQFIYDCHYLEKTEATNAIAQLSLTAHRLMKPVIALQVVLVLYFGFKQLQAFRHKVEEFYSNTAHKDLSEIKNLLFCFVITSIASVVADLTGRAFFIDSTILMTIILTPFSIMLFAIGYVGYHQDFTIDDLMAEAKGTQENEDVTEKVRHARLNNTPLPTEKRLPKEEEIEKEEQDEAGEIINTEQRNDLLKDIDQLMINERLFLQENLKLSDIANKLHTNRTYVYEALKQKEADGISSFTDYVNHFRVEYSLELLQKRPEESIEQILYECGFSSKSTFYANFKKIMGRTPKQYLKEMKKNLKSK